MFKGLGSFNSIEIACVQVEMVSTVVRAVITGLSICENVGMCKMLASRMSNFNLLALSAEERAL